MLWRACGRATQAVVERNAARRACVQASRVLGCPFSRRLEHERYLHLTARRSAGDVQVPLTERELLKQVTELRRQVDEEKLEVHGLAKNSTSLPAMTDAEMDLLYEAVQFPDPPTEEEMRLERRRQGLLQALETRSLLPNLEIQKRRALLRLHDVEKRLNAVNAFIEQQRIDRRDGDEVQKLMDTLGKATEQSKSIDGSDEEALNNQAEDVAQMSEEHVSHLSSSASVAGILSGVKDMMENFHSGLKFHYSLLNIHEWMAIARLSACTQNVDEIRQLLALMSDCGVKDLRTSVANTALDIFAIEGDIGQCMALSKIMQELGVPFDGYTKHCLVKCYSKCGHHSEADEMLQSFESTEPAGLQSYSLVIQGMLSERMDPRVQSKAWLVFKRMRMIAHPVPDAILYSRMIYACANGVPQPDDGIWKPRLPQDREQSPLRKPGSHSSVRRTADVERALDLFREMTNRYQIRPTPEVYAAIILACARRHDTYHTAIKLFESMLKVEQQRIASESFSSPSFAPDRRIFNAVLRGCSKNGDLVRARWILAEMLRGSMALTSALRIRGDITESDIREVKSRRPDAETLSLLFYTYASHRPAADSPSPPTKPPAHKAKKDAKQENATPALSWKNVEINGVTFSDTVPHSSALLMREVEGLLARVVEDEGRQDGLLSTVKPDRQMLAALLTVVARHTKDPERLGRMELALFGKEEESEECRQARKGLTGHKAWRPLLYGDSLYKRWSSPIDAKACAIVLEACARTTTVRTQAGKLADRVWDVFMYLLDGKRSSQASGSGTDIVSDAARARNDHRPTIEPDLISRCYYQRIQGLSRAERLEDAMTILREFVKRFPPSSHSKVARNEAKTIDAQGKPIGAPEKPLLTSGHLSLLIERLYSHRSADLEAEKKRHAHIGFIKYVSSAYLADLSPRQPKGIFRRVVERYKRP